MHEVIGHVIHHVKINDYVIIYYNDFSGRAVLKNKKPSHEPPEEYVSRLPDDRLLPAVSSDQSTGEKDGPPTYYESVSTPPQKAQHTTLLETSTEPVQQLLSEPVSFNKPPSHYGAASLNNPVNIKKPVSLKDSAPLDTPQDPSTLSPSNPSSSVVASSTPSSATPSSSSSQPRTTQRSSSISLKDVVVPIAAGVGLAAVGIASVAAAIFFGGDKKKRKKWW